MVTNKLVLRYLLKENLFSFLLVFSFSCLLFISIDLIELIRRSSTKEIELSILVKMAFLHIPSLFPIILPTVFLLSSMHTYMKLNKNSELVRKLSFTLQLSDPNDYEGGNVQLLNDEGKKYIAPRQRGTIILFEPRTSHRVLKVTKGTRRSIVGWVVGPRWK